MLATTSGASYIDTKLQQIDYYYCVKACDSTNNCSAVSNTGTNLPTGKFTEPANLISETEISKVSSRKAIINWVTEISSIDLRYHK